MDKWASNINKLCTAVTPYTYILIAVAFIAVSYTHLEIHDQKNIQAADGRND